MTVVATLKDGRVISKENITATIAAAAGKVYIETTFPDLKQVEYVLQFNFGAEDNTDLTPEIPTISGNVVGVTVYCGAGTTVTGHEIAIGF